MSVHNTVSVLSVDDLGVVLVLVRVGTRDAANFIDSYSYSYSSAHRTRDLNYSSSCSYSRVKTQPVSIPWLQATDADDSPVRIVLIVLRDTANFINRQIYYIT
eukprot:scaffold450905_cov38-Prasinocladus_malaysianus.AAC.2